MSLKSHRCLGRLRDQNPCFRAVIFSQFTSFLDLIQVVLRRDGFAFYRFDGEMSVKKKAEAVEEFTRPSRSGKVFIVSLKAGGVGLNVSKNRADYFMTLMILPTPADCCGPRLHGLFVLKIFVDDI